MRRLDRLSRGRLMRRCDNPEHPCQVTPGAVGRRPLKGQTRYVQWFLRLALRRHPREIHSHPDSKRSVTMRSRPVLSASSVALFVLLTAATAVAAPAAPGRSAHPVRVRARAAVSGSSASSGPTATAARNWKWCKRNHKWHKCKKHGSAPGTSPGTLPGTGTTPYLPSYADAYNAM